MCWGAVLFCVCPPWGWDFWVPKQTFFSSNLGNFQPFLSLNCFSLLLFFLFIWDSHYMHALECLTVTNRSLRFCSFFSNLLSLLFWNGNFFQIYQLFLLPSQICFWVHLMKESSLFQLHFFTLEFPFGSLLQYIFIKISCLTHCYYVFNYWNTGPLIHWTYLQALKSLLSQTSGPTKSPFLLTLFFSTCIWVILSLHT